jgi:hypothetical protein
VRRDRAVREPSDRQADRGVAVEQAGGSPDIVGIIDGDIVVQEKIRRQPA